VYFISRYLILLSSLPLTVGCAHLHSSKEKPPASSVSSDGALPVARDKGFFYYITHPLANFRLFPHKSFPPKAVALRKVGTVKTISKDGSFVIVELEAGVMVTPGSELLVTATGGEPAHLRVSDVKYPYFAADIVSGNPEPNDPVKE
jgi:hypothetical protein